ncbi:hypothetical protein L2E82_00246 [Cichorium intybus]|uniref:Uncharacterized protein n=1 Tax=Cichorium intybus TaxID=13427 RepID=A0ACB9GWH7_CICIN|nr:hypothetical protein L2E82_00246 [Cichorium intybus]
MARNQSIRTPSRGSCDRICKATFGQFRRSDPSFSSKSRRSFTQPMALQQPFLGKEIPIEYVPSPEVKSTKNVRLSGKHVEKDSSSTGGKVLADQKTFGEAKCFAFRGLERMSNAHEETLPRVLTNTISLTYSNNDGGGLFLWRL